MSWADIVGHAAVRQQLERVFRSGRMASTWLFAGPDGIGKRTFALQLARTLLCERHRGTPFDSCDRCPGCLQVQNGSHPDLLRVALPSGRSEIPVALLIGDRENRGSEGLCRSIAMKPLRGVGKVAIIDDANDLNEEGSNALLKTLEEPPPGTVLILVATSVHRVLPTILSRCQVARFEPVSAGEVVRVLERLAEFQPVRPLEELAALANGNVQMALLLNDPAVFSFRQEWLQKLATLDPAGDGESKRLVAFAEEAGKERESRRERMRMVSGVAIGFLDQVLLQCCGVDAECDPETKRAAGQACGLRELDPAWLSRCIDRTIEFQQHIDANVSLIHAVDGWLDDLSDQLRGKLPEPLAW